MGFQNVNWIYLPDDTNPRRTIASTLIRKMCNLFSWTFVRSSRTLFNGVNNNNNDGASNSAHLFIYLFTCLLNIPKANYKQFSSYLKSSIFWEITS
jgi:hypothetical protein